VFNRFNVPNYYFNIQMLNILQKVLLGASIHSVLKYILGNVQN